MRFYDNRKFENPGPGQYDQDSDVLLQKAPTICFGKELREVSSEQVSVDLANPQMYYLPLEPARPSWTFGTEQRKMEVRSRSPGPGAYDIKPTVPDVAKYMKPEA
jgi:hypothetical protein